MNNLLKIFVGDTKKKAKKKLSDPNAKGIDAQLYQRRLEKEKLMRDLGYR